MRSAETDPIFLPAALLVGVIAVPRIGRNDEHGSAFDLDAAFPATRGTSPALSYVNQLVIVQHASIPRIKVVISRMSC